MTDEVIVRAEGAVQVITINRPQARNAINRAVSLAIAAAVDELEQSDVLRVGVLTGADGHFSAGMDLKSFLAGESPEIAGRGLCGVTVRPPAKPLVAAVEGWALAAGLELVLACDLIIAAQGARFGLPEVKRGLIAAAGGSARLATRIPSSLALELLLTGDPWDADTARRAGLVNRVTEDGQALTVALELAERIAANAPLAIAGTRQIVAHAHEWSPAEFWQRHHEIFAPVFASDDAREGALAFAEKRAPRWTGR